MRRLSSRRMSDNGESVVNPMEGLGNLADAMLVLAVGIMLALILNWKLDITAISAETQPETEQIPIEESELNDADKQTLDEDAMQRVGALYYDEETGVFGAMLTWDAPETLPLHYNLYRTEPLNKTRTLIEINPDATSYFDEVEQGSHYYQLTAVYENCESDFALTPDGEDHIDIYVTDIQENTSEEIVTVLRIFSANGQTLTSKSLDDLSVGIYILQGLTEDGRIVNKKVFVRGE